MYGKLKSSYHINKIVGHERKQEIIYLQKEELIRRDSTRYYTHAKHETY